MAFLVRNFDKASVVVSSGAPFTYRYGSTTDTITVIAAGGYFNGVDNILLVGDILDITASDGLSLLKVTAVSPDVETIKALAPQDLQVIETFTGSDTLQDVTTYAGVTGGAAKQLILPTASVLIDGFQIIIKDEIGTAAADNITLTTEGSETIDTFAAKVMSTNFESVTVYARGGNWHIV